MAAKIVSFLFLALVAQAYSDDVTLIELEDQTVNIVSNAIIGRSITIPKLFLDSLESCHIIFPNGITYEAFPNSNIPQENIFFMDAVDMFRACAIGFRGITVDDAGTYELLSMVKHSDNTDSLTRQRFHVNVVVSEVQFPV